MNVEQIIQLYTNTTNKDITIILSVYSRPEVFNRMISNLDEIGFYEIWISCWHCEKYEVFYEMYKNLKQKTKTKLYFFSSNYQLKYFGRFQLAYQVQTKYTMILDDDCIIQENFPELCLKMINCKDYNGLLGVKGWIFPPENNSELGSYGEGKFFYPKPIWKRENDTKCAFEIDIVGGVWFFRSEWIKYLFYEQPYTFETGEDFHFSFMLRKYANIKTYFIPNDNNYKSYWGCTPDFEAIDKLNNSRNDRMGLLRKYIFWKQYTNICPYVKRIENKQEKQLCLLFSEEDFYLSRLLIDYDNYIFLLICDEQLNIPEDKLYTGANKYIFNFEDTISQKMIYNKLCTNLLNANLTKMKFNDKVEIENYMKILFTNIKKIYNFNEIFIFNHNEYLKYFNIDNLKIKNLIIKDLSLNNRVNSEKKFFHGEIFYFNFLLKNNINYALVRVVDGEYNILSEMKQDVNQDGWGLKNDDIFKNNSLIIKFKETFKNIYQDVYVGICCLCCVKVDQINFVKKYIGETFRNYTWGNIFVNANYKYFISHILKTLKTKKCILICNKKCALENINNILNIKKIFFLEKIWYECDNLLDDLKNYVICTDVVNEVFLFCAGPFSKIACVELYNINKNNTYLDIGSCFNDILGLGKNRGYLKGSYTIDKIDRWLYTEGSTKIRTEENLK